VNHNWCKKTGGEQTLVERCNVLRNYINNNKQRESMHHKI